MTYTVKEMIAEIHEDAKDAREMRAQILEQAKKTNGRVTQLESNPFVRMGAWMTDHPIKMIIWTILIGIVLNAWFVSDLRQPLLTFFMGVL